MAETGDLKTLYTRLIDSKDGYEQASERSQNAQHKALFSEMIDRRSRNAAQVRTYLSQKGEQMDEDGSILAAAHRTFLSLKDSVTGSSDEAILEEVIRGEESLLKAYDDAIASAGAGDPELSFLSQQHSELQAKISELKGREQAAA